MERLVVDILLEYLAVRAVEHAPADLQKTAGLLAVDDRPVS
jgi:hypothetical protein